MTRLKIVRKFVVAFVAVVALATFATPQQQRNRNRSHSNPAPTSPEGAAHYKQRCAMCHDSPQERVPPLFLIRRRSAEDVIQTLTSGAMKQQAMGLNPEQIQALRFT